MAQVVRGPGSIPTTTTTTTTHTGKKKKKEKKLEFHFPRSYFTLKNILNSEILCLCWCWPQERLEQRRNVCLWNAAMYHSRF